mgnify:FL=1
MLGKVIDILKNESFYIPNVLFKNYRNLNITDSELIILIYLINSDKTFNPKKISKDLNFKLNETMELINSLIEKGIIKIDIINKKVREEIFNLDELYNKLAFIIINGKEQKSTNIFDIFEKEFGRTLSPMDYEIISDWQKDFDDNLILLALKEAVFNNVNNLRYIDKIIRDWSKKGIKTEQDVINDRKKFESKKSNKKLFDYDWLNERDS